MMINEDKEYKDIREVAIDNYRGIYKDSLAFDRCGLDKPMRTRLLQDPVYLKATRALRAEMYFEQITTIDDIITDTRGEKDSSATKLKALEMKQKLLFQDMMLDADESNALNIAFVAMTREEFEKLETVEISEGSAETDLSNLKAEGEDETPEERMKSKIAKDIKSKKEKSNVK